MKFNGIWLLMEHADLSQAQLVKKRFGNTAIIATTLEGKITFRGKDCKRLQSLGVFSLPEVRILKNGHEYYTGLLSLLGEWNAETVECSLTVIGNDVVSRLIKVYKQKVEVFVPSYFDTDIRMSLRGQVKEVSLDEQTGTPFEALNNWVYDRTESYGSGTWFRHYYKKALIPKYSGVLLPQPVHLWVEDDKHGVDSEQFPRYSGYYSKASGTVPYYQLWKRGFKPVAEVLGNLLNGYLPQSGINIPNLHLDSPVIDPPDGLSYAMNRVMVADNKYLHTDIATLPWSANRPPPDIDYTVRSSYSLKELADAFLAYFNLVLCLREQQGSYYLSFRHYSKVHATVGGQMPYHDLTTLYGNHWSKPKHSPRLENLVYREMFESNSERPDWNGDDPQNQITYPVMLNYQDQEKKHPAGLVRTNIQDVVEGRVTDGICVVLWQLNHQGVRYIQTGAGILSGVHETNQVFSLSRVLRDYHTSGRRVMQDGKIGDEEKTFSQTLKNRQSELILAPVGVADLDFGKLVKTTLGQGELEEVKEYFDGRYSEIKLNY